MSCPVKWEVYEKLVNVTIRYALQMFLYYEQKSVITVSEIRDVYVDVMSDVFLTPVHENIRGEPLTFASVLQLVFHVLLVSARRLSNYMMVRIRRQHPTALDPDVDWRAPLFQPIARVV
jgi:hypothetical protein